MMISARNSKSRKFIVHENFGIVGLLHHGRKVASGMSQDLEYDTAKPREQFRFSLRDNSRLRRIPVDKSLKCKLEAAEQFAMLSSN